MSGRPLDYDTYDMHHRRNKGMGGTTRPDVDELWNLLALHPQVHNGGPDSVHGRRQWSTGHGYLVPKHVADDDLRAWPVLLHGMWAPRFHRWVLLGPGADYLPCPGMTTLLS